MKTKPTDPYLLVGVDIPVPPEVRRGFYSENECMAVFQFKLFPHDIGFITLHRNRGKWEVGELSVAAL
jgi:hypothetical protein